MAPTVRIILAIIVAFVCAPISAYAGGIDWQFFVESLRTDSSGQSKIVLNPVALASDNEKKWPNTCTSIVVTVRLDIARWYKGPPLPTTESHAEAIRLLREASESKKKIWFGEIGRGLLRASDDKCSVTSKGFSILDGSQGKAIFSFHDPV